MPYRRLPETDQARYTALKQALDVLTVQRGLNNHIVSHAVFYKLQSLFNQFATALDQFKDQFSGRVDNSKQYRKASKNAKMYLTHFLKVVNMSIQRGELPNDIKKLYKLDHIDKGIPQLRRDKDVLEIGRNVIEGELRRIQMGGFPIYHPNINKVKLHYDIFKEASFNNDIYKKNIRRISENIEALRKQIDAFIPELWDQIEGHFANLSPTERLASCQQCGVIYYYRKEENIVKDRLAHLFKDIAIINQIDE